jgi:hypothetical protein
MSEVTLGGTPIGVLTSFNIEDTRITRRIHEMAQRTTDLVPAGKQTYTATITKLWLHPKLRPLPWGTRNPPVHVLRQWWVHHLGKTNRSFKRTRLASIRRLWRERRAIPVTVTATIEKNRSLE